MATRHSPAPSVHRRSCGFSPAHKQCHQPDRQTGGDGGGEDRNKHALFVIFHDIVLEEGEILFCGKIEEA